MNLQIALDPHFEFLSRVVIGGREWDDAAVRRDRLGIGRPARGACHDRGDGERNGKQEKDRSTSHVGLGVYLDPGFDFSFHSTVATPSGQRAVNASVTRSVLIL